MSNEQEIADRERKAWAKILNDMVGKHGRANDPGLWLAAKTLDPSLNDFEFEDPRNVHLGGQAWRNSEPTKEK